ncbi:hypothetical protein HHK36_030861 [Tetracentron sinense]|uniref:TF-B3 domain-containing protein n=1 Tax=Tetracentron sinense TaxID=13715 RepID=A0A834Y8J8_TETSI|nr:hypothetical protein HHK36_030861 [Tetracentron sinense]
MRHQCFLWSTLSSQGFCTRKKMVKALKMISSSPEFFKVYIPELSSQKLRIPPAFVKNVDVVVPNKTILKDPSGEFWHVELKEDENDLFFQNGWQDFVKNHFLEHGDFLIFRYNGNLVFDVRIFGKTGCKKEEALVNGNIDKTDSYVKREEPGTMEILRKPTLECKPKYSIRPQNIVKSKCLPDVDGCTRSKRTVTVKVEEGRVFEAADFGEPTNFNITASINPSRPYMLTYEAGSSWMDIEEDASSAFSSASPSSYSFQEEMGCAAAKLSAADHGFADFSGLWGWNTITSCKKLTVMHEVVVIEDESVPSNLHVPKELVTTNFGRMKSAVIFRDPNGKSWPVSVCFREDGRFDITKGWQNFWRRNGLGGHDKCIFEFKHGKDGRYNVIQVHIYRAAKGASKPHRYMTRR